MLFCGSPSRWSCQCQEFDHRQRAGSDVGFESAARFNHCQSRPIFFPVVQDRCPHSNVRNVGPWCACSWFLHREVFAMFFSVQLLRGVPTATGCTKLFLSLCRRVVVLSCSGDTPHSSRAKSECRDGQLAGSEGVERCSSPSWAENLPPACRRSIFTDAAGCYPGCVPSPFT